MVRKRQRKKCTEIDITSIQNVDDDTESSAIVETKCKHCGSLFVDPMMRQRHEEMCESQPNVFTTSDGKIRFLCSICNQLFKYQTGLKKHELRHKPPGGFVCPECNEPFITDAERTIHKEIVHKIFKCLICNEKCSSEEKFLQHINELHEGRDREFVVCADCGAQFRQKVQLRLHCESKCGTVKCYTCNQCKSQFMTQNTLNAHMLIHTGEKKHLCNYCGNSFLSRGQLKIHERSHTKEKPYKCLVCEKAFAHRESLVTHSSLHTGIKPYQCQCCGSQFSCIGNLIKHRRIRPQTCGLPQYTNTKCAPRASTKIPGSLTLKKENPVKRAYAKRKIVSVPELLSIRAELTSQADTKNQPKHEHQEFEEFLILNKDQSELDSTHVIETTPSGECIEILDDKLINAPTTSNNTNVSYNIPNTGVLVLTPDGNYVIANLANNVSTKPIEIKMAPPQMEQVIILNSNDIQFAEMEVDCQETDLLDTKGNIEILQETSLHRSPISIDDTQQIDDTLEPQYVENNIQHLEISPNIPETIASGDETYLKSVDQPDPQIIEVFVCELCSKQFRQQKYLMKHLELKHNIECLRKELKCNYCSREYSNEKLLNKHMKCHGPSGKLVHKCPCCQTYFETKAEMQSHAQTEHEDRLKCNYCGKMFKDVDCRTAHVRKLHMKTGAPQKKYTFVCSKCGKKFKSRVALSDHEQGDCGRAPIYKCEFENCGKSLHSLGSLKIHQLIHTGDLPYSCGFCKKKFRTQGQVKVHERSHNGDKPFKCSDCPKAFAHRESLLTHISLHTGIKRFGCQGCLARFSCISNLQAHRRTHQNTCGQLPLDTKAQYSYNTDDSSIVLESSPLNQN